MRVSAPGSPVHLQFWDENDPDSPPNTLTRNHNTFFLQHPIQKHLFLFLKPPEAGDNYGHHIFLRVL